jgi:sterol desaturase/sphingolipid hydroxylase (fatty acid hydroxylase superfamily)
MTIGLIRFGIFALVLAAMALLERRFPLRAWRTDRPQRFASHAGLGLLAVAVPAILVRIAPALAGAGAAGWAASQGFGLLNVISLSPAWAIPLAILLLDLAIYGQHRAMHRWPLLWRLHAVHHDDHDLDVTTALRFHPGEILLSTVYKAGAAALIGAPVIAVIIHETLLSAMALFNHANIALPPRLERWVQPLLVTPTMHARHHATVRADHDSNYGNMLSLWDRLFGSYSPEPTPPTPFPIGLGETQGEQVTGLRWMLARPFR